MLALTIALFATGCCSSTPPAEIKTVSGIVIDVQLEREDSTTHYVFVRFEDKFVKLRSKYSAEVNIPTGRLISINYSSDDLKIHSIEPKGSFD